MPIFFNNKLLFLHIPKCGGDTVSHQFLQNGDPPFLFAGDGSVLVNGHTPQHMTWREMRCAGWGAAAGFRVAALVRHPVERVISAFNYLRAKKPTTFMKFPTPSAFLDAFLSRDRVQRLEFDQHNLSILEFLQDETGLIDPRIEIYPIQKMDTLMQSFGLPPVKPADRRNVTNAAEAAAFSAEEIARIAAFYRADVRWFEQRYPAASRFSARDV